MPPDQPAGGVPQDDAWLHAWTSQAWMRWRVLAAVHALLWGIVATGLMWAMLARWGPAIAQAGAIVAGMLVAGASLWRTAGVRDVRPLLQHAERTRPGLRNALLTWHEGVHGLTPVSDRFRIRIAAHARVQLTGAPWPRPFTTRRWVTASAAALGATALGASLAAVTTSMQGVRRGTPPLPASVGAAGPVALTWTALVTPPAYTQQPVRQLVQPDVISGLRGGHVTVRFDGWPAGAEARLGDRLLTAEAPAEAPLGVDAGLVRRNARRSTMLDDADRRTRPTATPEGRHVVTFPLEASDILLVSRSDGALLSAISVRVAVDAAPIVRITAPAQDLRRAQPVGTIAIDARADDDLGLRELRLRYTKVSGSGESFEFAEGEWPMRMRRESALRWQGHATLDLATLGLGPGDVIVYYATARDARPGVDGLSESERFLIEIPKPGDLAGGDFSLPEPERRYALSQRMLIQLTERLLERRSRLDAEEYLREAQGLAAHQRRIRAEFVFLMGGEVVDEAEEAAHSHEIEAGRLQNHGQEDLLEAVRQMAQAETRLTGAQVADALPFEYRALNALQAAFGKSRYFMRTLPIAVQIDLSRRLEGDRSLADPSGWTRWPVPDEDRARGLTLLARLESREPRDGAATSALVADLLAFDRETPDWARLVQRFASATADVRATMADRDAAVASIGAALRARLHSGAPSWMPLRVPLGAAETTLTSTRETPR